MFTCTEHILEVQFFMCFRINNVCYIIFTYVKMSKLWNRSIHVISEAICKYHPLIKGFLGGGGGHPVWSGFMCYGACVCRSAFEVWTFIEEIGNTLCDGRTPALQPDIFPLHFKSFPLSILYWKRILTVSPDMWLSHFETNVQNNLGNSCL